MRPWIAAAVMWLALPAAAGEPTPTPAATATATPTASSTSTPTATLTPTPTQAAPGRASSTAAHPERGAAGAEPRGASTEVAGTVAAVDLQRHRVTVVTAAGQVELGWDRNTLIYQPGGATTAAALRPGAVVKAGLDPARTAYWIQVRPAPPEAPAAAPSGR